MGITWHLVCAQLHSGSKMMLLVEFSWRRTPNISNGRMVEMPGEGTGDLRGKTEQVLLVLARLELGLKEQPISMLCLSVVQDALAHATGVIECGASVDHDLQPTLLPRRGAHGVIHQEG